MTNNSYPDSSTPLNRTAVLKEKPIQELREILPSFYLIEIETKSFLIAKESGEVQVINEVARLFCELAELGSSNKQIIDDVSQVLSVKKNQVSTDLSYFCSTLVDALVSNSDEKTDSIEDMDLLPLESFELAQTNTQQLIIYRYQIHELSIEVAYPSDEVARPSHSILAPMMIEERNTNSCYTAQPNHLITIDLGKNSYLLSIDKKPTFCISNLDLVANYLRTSFINLAGKGIQNWLSIHAAAIADRSDKAVIFAAPSGSGKSTLSLELCSKGAHYLGDDMLMVDLDQKELIPFGTSVNLKPGSWPLFKDRYPELSDIAVLNESTRPVKYLPFKIHNQNRTYSIKAIVFPNFDKHGENKLTKLDIDQVIYLLSESGCYSTVSASVEMSKVYLEFFLGLKAYKLNYQSSNEAIELLRKNGLTSI